MNMLMLGCKLHKKNSLNACLRIDLFFYIMTNSFYNKDAYHNTLFLLWYDHNYSVTVTGLGSPKLWVPVSARIQRWRTGGGSEMWRGWNRSKNQETWPKHLGHCHLELNIILFTQLLWFGMHCVENWSQRKQKETEIDYWRYGGEYTRCLCDVCGTICFHSQCQLFIESVKLSTISFLLVGNTKTSSKVLNPNSLRKCFKAVRKRNGGSQDTLRRSEEIQNCKFCINRQDNEKINCGNISQNKEQRSQTDLGNWIRQFQIKF